MDTKIGIITLHAVKNYGSVLQAFATQSFFEKHGCEVQIINYVRENCRPENLYKTYGMGNPVKMILMAPTIHRWRHVFGDFCEQYLHLTNGIYTSEDDFTQLPLDADLYCTGSDQVWNSKWNRGILPPLYLSFVPDHKYKFAFSASFGQSRLGEDEANATREYIRRYARISVRESSAVEILEEQYKYHGSVHILDPTLCLGADFWRKYASKNRIKDNYILVYNLNRSRAFDKYAVALSKKTGLKLVRFCTRYDQFYRPGKSMLVPEVFDFISLIDNARYVLTDSFHATAFSMNMNTEPICVYPAEFGGRLESFLKLTNSEQRHIQSYEDFDVVNCPVDFNSVNRILMEERRKADLFVDGVLEDARNFYGKIDKETEIHG